jgi:MOSC domain-containing protein YiiM
MRIVSLNTGLPREVSSHGQRVMTGIYKTPVAGRLPLRRLNFEGDGQADLSVHGGEFKAVYCYPHEHYSWWAQRLEGRDLPMGTFGENLTTEGLDEQSVHVGDRFSIGSAHVIVTQPRLPCYKLGIRFESDAMVKRFLASGRSGFYLAVEREGEVGAGDAVTVLARDPRQVSIASLNRIYVQKTFDASDIAIATKALRIPVLPEGWKERARRVLATSGSDESAYDGRD